MMLRGRWPNTLAQRARLGGFDRLRVAVTRNRLVRPAAQQDGRSTSLKASPPLGTPISATGQHLFGVLMPKGSGSASVLWRARGAGHATLRTLHNATAGGAELNGFRRATRFGGQPLRARTLDGPI